MRLWPQCLTYGNWGGPGWSGGAWVDNPDKVDWSVDPVDDMDAAFKEHDRLVQAGHGRLAHKILAVMLERQDPPNGPWAKLYRLACIAIFTLMGLGTA
jgi:hypothetical protein